MKHKLVFLTVFAISLANTVIYAEENISPFSKVFFVTRVNHFYPQDTRLATFEYIVNKENYQNDGPIFIHINSGDLSNVEWLKNGLVRDVSKEVHGITLSVQIRYYGNNRPTEHAGNDNLKFLTVEQILADIPHLIDSIRKEYNATKKSRIILCGSGFGGTLAAWARQKYPHLVYGVWSSSGIFHRVLHTKEPYESLTLTIREYGGSKCAENVAEAFDKILESVLLYELEYLKSIFNLCDLLWLYNEDIGMFYNGLINYIITYFNAYNYDGIQQFCKDMDTSVANDAALNLFGKWVTKHYANDHCLDYDYLSVLYNISYINWDSPMVANGARQNLHLKCTQLAQHATTVNADIIFARTIPQDYYRLVCQDAWYRFDYMTSKQAVEQLNQQYGGKLLKITKAIFSNGKLDVNYAFGVTEYGNKDDTHVINISRVGKSADFWQKSSNDTIAVSLAKDMISAILIEWSKED